MVGFSIIVVMLMFMVGIVVVGAVLTSYAVAATAADAAALAAAPVTFRPFGATGTAQAEAAKVARANGARLVRCVCVEDRSWGPRTISVTVVRNSNVPLLGSLAVTATSRAVFDPTKLLSRTTGAHHGGDG